MNVTINEDAVVELFRGYSKSLNVQEAFETFLQDIIDEDVLSEGELEYVIEDVLIPEMVVSFAKHYVSMNECYGYEHDPNEVFHTYCEFHTIYENLKNALATTINVASADEHEDDEDADDVIFDEDDWKKLSPQERNAKIKNFLKKIGHAHIDARDGLPFIKQSLNIGDKPDTYGNRWGEKVKQNRFGHSANESIHFPDHHGTGYDELHRAHPLHKTLIGHGYNYSHTAAVNQPRGGVLHHHIWQHPHGFQVGSYEGDTSWSSKTHAASGHLFSGVGMSALSKHLKNRAQRYKIQNTEFVASTKLQEGLLDLQTEKIQFYKRFMERNPATLFGHRVDDASPAQQLTETWRNKVEADAKFNYGKHPEDWSLFDYRSGKPK